jgi:hypothetical protein
MGGRTTSTSMRQWPLRDHIGFPGSGSTSPTRASNPPQSLDDEPHVSHELWHEPQEHAVLQLLRILKGEGRVRRSEVRRWSGQRMPSAERLKRLAGAVASERSCAKAPLAGARSYVGASLAQHATSGDLQPPLARPAQARALRTRLSPSRVSILYIAVDVLTVDYAKSLKKIGIQFVVRNMLAPTERGLNPRMARRERLPDQGHDAAPTGAQILAMAAPIWVPLCLIHQGRALLCRVHSLWI